MTIGTCYEATAYHPREQEWDDPTKKEQHIRHLLRPSCPYIFRIKFCSAMLTQHRTPPHRLIKTLTFLDTIFGSTGEGKRKILHLGIPWRSPSPLARAPGQATGGNGRREVYSVFRKTASSVMPKGRSKWRRSRLSNRTVVLRNRLAQPGSWITWVFGRSGL